MKSIIALAAGVAALIPCAVSADATPPAPPLRHLVYTFTWGTSNDLEVHSAGIDANGTSQGSGKTDYTGGSSDQGLILVDVLREQPDKGLVVSISEQAEGPRSAHAATCVVYGNTQLICDPNAKVNAEEDTLLRFLGSNFVDPAQIDEKHHWQQAENEGKNYSVTADYTIASNNDGIMTIEENRTVKEITANASTTSITTKIGYDFKRTLPTSVLEYTIEREQVAMGQYQTIKTETELSLKSDSMAAPAH